MNLSSIIVLREKTGHEWQRLYYMLWEVPENKIMEDYLTSNDYRQAEINKVIGIPTKTFPKMDSKQVKPEWLEATASAIIR